MYDDLGFSKVFPNCSNIPAIFWELDSFKYDKWNINDFFEYENGTEAE
jgi:hypothetical protein